jgi:hypothetical protein
MGVLVQFHQVCVRLQPHEKPAWSMFLPLMCTAKIICSLTLAPEGSDHRDQNTKEKGFLLPQADGRTGARPFQSPAVWGSRGSTELPNGEKKMRRSRGGAHRRQGCRDVGGGRFGWRARTAACGSSRDGDAPVVFRR